MTLWQFSAGSNQRDYSQFFFDFGIACLGGENNTRRLEEIRLGDLIALKRGTSAVVAIGKVVKLQDKQFDKAEQHWLMDFDGWELPYYVNVNWQQFDKELLVSGLSRGTLKRVKDPNLKKLLIDKFDESRTAQPISSFPKPVCQITVEILIEKLIQLGLSVNMAEDFTSALSKIRRLVKYYKDNCKSEDIREHETRTFLVIPLLLALGWSEQQIKIELKVPSGRVDVACFTKPYQSAIDQDQCQLIIETKGFAQGLSLAPTQALNYAKHFPSAKAVVVTNGYCYKIYDLSNRTQTEIPTAYLNLIRPTDRYHLNPDQVAGAIEAIQFLIP